jgi:hypothetical protein
LLYPFTTMALERGEGQRHALTDFTPGKDLVPIAPEAGWAPRPVWTGAENLAPPPGFDPRTVQPLAIRYTNCATRPTNNSVATKKSDKDP